MKPEPPATLYYLDDLSVGQRFTSASYVVGEAEIKAFATQYDPQPFHLDHEAAKDTIFAGLAASGWHTAAITMKLLVDCTPIAGGILGAGGEIAWPKPTRPGDVLQVTAEILEITRSKSRSDRGSAMMRIETRNQHGELVQSFAVRTVVPVRPGAGREPQREKPSRQLA